MYEVLCFCKIVDFLEWIMFYKSYFKNIKCYECFLLSL